MMITATSVSDGNTMTVFIRRSMYCMGSNTAVCFLWIYVVLAFLGKKEMEGDEGVPGMWIKTFCVWGCCCSIFCILMTISSSNSTWRCFYCSMLKTFSSLQDRSVGIYLWELNWRAFTVPSSMNRLVIRVHLKLQQLFYCSPSSSSNIVIEWPTF